MNNKRKEQIISGSLESCGSISFLPFASQEIGAAGFSTGMTTYPGGASAKRHFHEVSEAMTILEGRARLFAEDREYRLAPLDCVHVPAGLVHSVENVEPGPMLRIHSAFGSAQPKTEYVEESSQRPVAAPGRRQAERILRFADCPVYELSPGAFFRDLFAQRLGASGICGGYGLFDPGASLPCHTHKYDESITIVSGKANCLVRGNRYQLSGYDTAFVPEGEPHRFINESNQTMAMIWVYAGDEPDRLLVDNGYCSGLLPWPGDATS